MTFFSQFGEDRLLAEIFSGKSKGYCVEVGANDGVNDSTTFYFERLGWDCLLIEPNPDLCKLIRKSRSSPLFQCAASDRDGEVSLFIAEGANRAHGVSSMHDAHFAQERIRAFGFTSREVKVESRKLDDILRGLEISPGIDFVSIDVEGHELAVLRGFSLKYWSPRILLIEDNENYCNPVVRDYLASQGYMPFLRTGVNDWYASAVDQDLVNWRSGATYKWGELQARAKAFARRIPGVLFVWGLWKKIRIRL